MVSPNQAPVPRGNDEAIVPSDWRDKLVRSAHSIIELSDQRKEIHSVHIEDTSENGVISSKRELRLDRISTAMPIEIVPVLVGAEHYDNVMPLVAPEGAELSDEDLAAIIFLGNHTVAATFFLKANSTIQAARQFTNGWWTQRYAPKPETTKGLVDALDGVEQQLVKRRARQLQDASLVGGLAVT